MDVTILVDGVSMCDLSSYYTLQYSFGYGDSCDVSSGDIEIYIDYISSYAYYYGATTDTWIDVYYGGTLVESYNDAGGFYNTYPGTYVTLAESDYAVFYTDATEIACGSDPLDSSDEPADMDGDGLCDEIQDDDNDGDGYSNLDETVNCWEGNVASDGTYYNLSLIHI